MVAALANHLDHRRHGASRSAAMAFNRIANQPRRRSKDRIACIARWIVVSWFRLRLRSPVCSPRSHAQPFDSDSGTVALGSVFLFVQTVGTYRMSLGWCLAIAPTAAWIAVRGQIGSAVPLLLSLVVLLWTAGFDVLYACQDVDFDRAEGLHSIPARVGIANALWIARVLHAASFLALVSLYFLTNLGYVALVGVAVTGVLLLYQHHLVKANDLSRLNSAFFTTNAFVSVILLFTFGAAVFIH